MEVSPAMQQQIVATRAELQAVRARIAAADQSKRLLDLSSQQVKKEHTNDRVWQGVGRMFIKESASEFISDVEKRDKELDEQRSALEKKQAYYKVTLDKMLDAVKQ